MGSLIDLSPSTSDFITTDPAKIGEGEFRLIHELNSQLIVHHPYRTLSEVQTVLGLTTEEKSLAWSVVNDHYITDLPLLYPPHVIAITAAFFTIALKPTQTSSQTPTTDTAGAGAQNKLQKFTTWLAESDVDMEAIIDCMQEMISLYEVWEQYNERVCKEQIARFVKARSLDK